MWGFFLTSVVPAIVTGISAAVAWMITNFFLDPLLQFYPQRPAIYESLFFTANLHKDNAEPMLAGMDELRRHAARLDALWQTCPTSIKWYLRKRGFDVELAARDLTGLSNALGSTPYARELHRHRVERGLKFPYSCTIEDLENLRELERR